MSILANTILLQVMTKRKCNGKVRGNGWYKFWSQNISPCRPQPCPANIWGLHSSMCYAALRMFKAMLDWSPWVGCSILALSYQRISYHKDVAKAVKNVSIPESERIMHCWPLTKLAKSWALKDLDCKFWQNSNRWDSYSVFSNSCCKISGNVQIVE